MFSTVAYLAAGGRDAKRRTVGDSGRYRGRCAYKVVRRVSEFFQDCLRVHGKTILTRKLSSVCGLACNAEPPGLSANTSSGVKSAGLGF